MKAEPALIGPTALAIPAHMTHSVSTSTPYTFDSTSGVIVHRGSTYLPLREENTAEYRIVETHSGRASRNPNGMVAVKDHADDTVLEPDANKIIN